MRVNSCRHSLQRFLLLGARWNVALAMSGLICLVLGSRAQGVESALSLSVIPSTRLVRQGDPLLLRVEIANQGSDEVSVPRPTRDYYSLALFIELKPHTGLFAEALPGTEKPGGTNEFVVKGRGKLVTYDCLYRYLDADAVFRQYGEYELYAVLRRGEAEIVKSERITITVSTRAKSMQRTIDQEMRLVNEALNRHVVYLGPPAKGPATIEGLDRRTYAEKIEALEKLRLDLRKEPGTLDQMLEWRIELLRLKYGSQEEQDAARARLDELREGADLDPISKDVLSLFAARVHVARGDWRAAQKMIEFLADSPEKRDLARLIDNERKKDPSGTP